MRNQRNNLDATLKFPGKLLADSNTGVGGTILHQQDFNPWYNFGLKDNYVILDHRSNLVSLIVRRQDY